MIDPDAAITFIDFVEARHDAWVNRQLGLAPPWTDDPIVASRKFTNVFRAIDHGSQFFIRELMDPELDEREMLMRCFLYRFTNRPEPWIHFREVVGRMPLIEDLDGPLLKVWNAYRSEEMKIFSGAYMIRPQGENNGLGVDKLESILGLARDVARTNIPSRFLAAANQVDRFAALHSYKGVGPFMSLQIMTDYGYSDQCGEDREDEFVVGGPGSIRGAKEIDPSAKTEDVIREFQEILHASPGCPELPLDGYGENYRKPSLMDTQNCFCEFSKYARFSRRAPAQKLYSPAHPGVPSPLVLPKHF